MFVHRSYRGRGYSSAPGYAQLERTAAAAGRRRAVLETGTRRARGDRPLHERRLPSRGPVRVLPRGSGLSVLRQAADPGPVLADHLIVIQRRFPLGCPGELRRSVWRDPHDRRRRRPAGDGAAGGGYMNLLAQSRPRLSHELHRLRIRGRVYFVLVLGIGLVARRSVASSLDFFLSGRSLPAWVTGLAFISANLGAVEIIGHVGERRPVRHADAPLLLDRRRPGDAVPGHRDDALLLRLARCAASRNSCASGSAPRTQLVNASCFAVAQVLIAGVNLYAARPRWSRRCSAGRCGSG